MEALSDVNRIPTITEFNTVQAYKTSFLLTTLTEAMYLQNKIAMQ